MVTLIVLALLNQVGGDYVGYVKENTFIYQIEEWVKNPFSDTTYYGIDTMWVVDSTEHEGYPAWNIREFFSIEGLMTSDTTRLYWFDDPYFKLQAQMSCSVTVDQKILKVPFSVGNNWSSGIKGIYIDDYDMDTKPDTYQVICDTSEVLGIEDVTVPYGVVNNTYKIKTTREYKFWYSMSGMTSTIQNKLYQWWKPDLGCVKDSNYMKMIFPTFTQESVVKKELEKFTQGVSEEPETSRLFDITYCSLNNGNMIISLVLHRAEEIALKTYTVAGRVVESQKLGVKGKGKHYLNWGADKLGSGIYFVHLTVGKEVYLLKMVLLR